MSTHVLSDAEMNALRNLVPIGPGTYNPGQADALAPYRPAQVQHAPPVNEWPDARIELLRNTFAAGATPLEFELFLGTCKRLRLSPEARQIFSVSRWDSQQQANIRQTQVSIDGLRLIAERTGQYRGQTPVEWCGKDGVWKDIWLEDVPPAAARVGVLREGFSAPLYRTAKWSAFVQLKRDGKPNQMWATKGDHMLAKVAEALALRTAFPNECSGVYTEDEMGQANNGAPEVKAEVVESRPVGVVASTQAEIDARKAAADRPNTRPARKIGVNDGKQETKPEDTSPVIGGDGPHAGKHMSQLSDSEVIDVVRQMMHVADNPRWAERMAAKIAVAKAYAATRNIVDFSVAKEERARQLAAAVKGAEHEYSDDMYWCENHGMYGSEPGMDSPDIRKWNNPEKLVEYINWLRATYSQPTQTGRIACAEKCLEKLIKDEADRAEKALAAKK